MDKIDTPLQKLSSPLFDKAGIELYIKREDLIHPFVSGNKWRKLKYNLEEAKVQGFKTMLTFGGAFSNHIYSTAAAGRIFGFKTVGVIRGEECLPLNPTLSFAKEQGMEFFYIDRETYREKNSAEVLQVLNSKFGKFYLVPEGGSNELAIVGVRELIDEIDIPFDMICAPVGTGGTLSGLISGIKNDQQALGFAALKGKEYLEGEVRRLLGGNNWNNWDLTDNYAFGGYGKINKDLVIFMKEFEQRFSIPLDPVYTGKMMYGIFDLAEKGFFEKDKTVIVLHTGGLQGLAGMKPKMDKLLNS